MTLMQILLPINVAEMIASELKKEGKRETGGLLFAEHIGGTTFKIVEATVQKSSGTPVEFVRDPAQHRRSWRRSLHVLAMTVRASTILASGTRTQLLSPFQADKIYEQCALSSKIRTPECCSSC
jgi:hypothetical protein